MILEMIDFKVILRNITYIFLEKYWKIVGFLVNYNFR